MGDLGSLLRVRRRGLEDRLARQGLLHTLSAARFQLHRELTRTIGEHLRGEVLEAGAGREPYREMLARVTDSVFRVDIDPSHGVDLVADVQDMHQISSGSFDGVLSTQVLEHVADPYAAMSEMSRVLRPGGLLVLSAPHLSMIHDAPTDYFRYTEFGLRSLAEANALEVLEVRPVGGPLSLGAHVLSVGFMSAVGTLPGCFWISWALNYLLLVRCAALFDRPFAFAVLPRDYVIVAVRR